ncbi:hypothetical protein Poli38472_012232 [Pythium oligandrum]|uniref:Tc1-like transposase DDE domain-containing protein n=1 Tax=Pythium oligandrum TaxID=41045 RepID=A0A8K1CNX5_PYTOL|nr:hypothetical protein Poli38472_012232 [Pythium oligandrum]|eukprot:TMW67116.1 hypothetical protein Poli38472_012232 [Pythium oligandrum]
MHTSKGSDKLGLERFQGEIIENVNGVMLSDAKEMLHREYRPANVVSHMRLLFASIVVGMEFVVSVVVASLARELELAELYCKSVHTISNWIRTYETLGIYERASSTRKSKYNEDHRKWLFNYFTEKPLSYLDEAQPEFKRVYGHTMSVSTVWRINNEQGLTWKVLERRAMHIKERDVFRFVEELSSIDWSHQNLVFLDEVSFDNRDMVRKRGYSLKGKTLAIRGDFQRKPRVSLLAFIGVNGLIDHFDTAGTFDRIKFVECCQTFVHSKRGNVDGASIHRHPDIVNYLRSVGVVPISLHAYCPFFNPIEYMFGFIKKSFQRHYDESSGRDLLPYIVVIFESYRHYNMSHVFKRCGWMPQRHFDPSGHLSRDQRTASSGDGCDRFGFREREEIVEMEDEPQADD